MGVFSGYTGMTRLADDVFIVEREDSTRFIESMIKAGHMTFLLIGPPYSGKTTFMESISDEFLWLYRLNQKKILGQIFREGQRVVPTKIYTSFRKFERELVEIARATGTPLLKETTGSTPQSRYVDSTDPRAITVLVFDAPAQTLRKRAVDKGMLDRLTEEQLSYEIAESQSNFRWPKPEEGFKAIYYITQAERAEELLKTVVIKESV